MEVIRLAQRLRAQGNTITVMWAPARRGVDGNEQADLRAGETALPPPPPRTRRYSLALLRRRATEQAT